VAVRAQKHEAAYDLAFSPQYRTLGSKALNRSRRRPIADGKPRRQVHLSMSRRELQRVECLHLLDCNHISPREACDALSVSRSHLYRLLNQYRSEGLAGIVSKQRGAPSNRAYPDSTRRRVISLIESKYFDFGPTLIAEVLEEAHGMKISRETIRQWMIKAGLWLTNRIARKRLHQPRKRMPAYGDLVQLDGSYHDWFEGRGPACNLMVAVDDSTSHIQVLRFTPVEDRKAYFQVMDQYVRAHGRPIRVLTDRHAGVWSQSSKTDFSRAMDQLGIIHSVAMSPQSKGRVERMNRTLQDRLVKAMRLRGISSIEEANRFALFFLKKYNRTFGRSPQAPEDHHRPAPVAHDIELAFAERHRRRVTKGFAFSFAGERYVIRSAPRLDIRTVDICINVSGEMSVMGPSGRLEFDLVD